MRQERSEADLAFIIQAMKNYVRFTWKTKKGSYFYFEKRTLTIRWPRPKLKDVRVGGVAERTQVRNGKDTSE